jgi:hypothetical protein
VCAPSLICPTLHARRGSSRGDPSGSPARRGDGADQRGEFAVPVFVRSLRKCADFCYSVFTVWSHMSDLSILKKRQLSAICATSGE